VRRLYFQALHVPMSSLWSNDIRKEQNQDDQLPCRNDRGLRGPCSVIRIRLPLCSRVFQGAYENVRQALIEVSRVHRRRILAQSRCP